MRYHTALLSCVLMVACADNVTPPDSSYESVNPAEPLANELVNPDERLGTVNSHVYGSFSVAAGGGVIMSGPANFPGKPKAGPGTCDQGLWINAQGKRTSGSVTKPHPHCFSPVATIEVVLEPISACYSGAQDALPVEELPADLAEPAEPSKELAEPSSCAKVAAVKGATLTVLTIRNQALAEDGTTLWDPATVHAVDFRETAPDNTTGKGVIVGYGIDAATLGTTNHRVGTLRIDLSQYASQTTALIHLNDAAGCDIDEQIESPCLNRVITATYNPLPVGGLGPTDASVEGFLWVMPASSPYNYTE